jgi:hypothetical protein
MKKGISNKLTLGKKTISKLQIVELRGVNGGSSYHTFRCHTNSCAPTWNCPPSGGSGSGSSGSESIGRNLGGGQFLIQPEEPIQYC